jgi:hypothetical protein
MSGPALETMSREALVLLRGQTLMQIDQFKRVPRLVARNVQITMALQDLEVALGPPRDTVRWAEAAAAILSCPNCNALVTLKDGELVPGDPDAQDLVAPPEEVELARRKIEDGERGAAALQAELARNIAAVQEVQRLKTTPEELRTLLQLIDAHLAPKAATT